MKLLELAKKINQVARLQGDFLLRSGQRSSIYFDKYRFESQPELLREIANHLAPLIPPGTQVLAGLELGGVPIATALSLKTGLPVAFIRKTAKSYGTCQFAEGIDIKNKKVAVIEDVITTGGQVILSTQDLRNAGAHVDTVLCAILRSENTSELEKINMKVIPLLTKKLLDDTQTEAANSHSTSV